MFSFIKAVLLTLMLSIPNEVANNGIDTNTELIIPLQQETKVKPFFGTATWYGEYFHGRKTASGDIYNMHGLTCATRNRNIPLGSKLKITNIKTGKSVIVTVNDRMAKYGKHTIDLSVGAFIKLAPRKQGVIKIKIEKI